MTHTCKGTQWRSANNISLTLLACLVEWGFIPTPPNQCSPPPIFLGFIFNSLQMTVSPTQEKIPKTFKECSDLLMMINPPIFKVAKVIGILVSNFPEFSLELEAAFFALKSFGDMLTEAHIQLHLDNTTAVAYINNMGGSKSLELNCLALKMWDWSITRDNWISTLHLAGKLNVRADAAISLMLKHEWTLNSNVFTDILSQYPDLNIDLFATRLNHKLPTYCSWKPDLGCSFIDAFSVNWGAYHFYAFPPIILIPRCLQKISQDQAKEILVVPLWPTQSWFPIVLQLLYNQPWILSPDKRLLSHPALKEPHPLWKELNLMVCPLSGTPSDSLTFYQRSQTSSWLHGDQVHKNNTKVTSYSGSRFVVRGQLITIHHRSVML